VDERVLAVELAVLSGAIGSGLDARECDAILGLLGALEVDLRAERIGWRWAA
jgi:hypothetical protein